VPRRTDIQKILLIGSGPIVIGQGAEFDYSGTQAAKALREEGYTVVLVNSNPATIMTDPEFADRTYIEPITPEVVEAILEREKPDAILPTMGGQTALNVALALADSGVLEKYGVELIGAKIDAIKKAEDRLLFKDAMRRIGLETPVSQLVNNVEAGLAIVPVMIAAATFGFISYLVGNVLFADYLQIHFVQGTGELAVICGALVGAGLGFLWFNAPPALIFMGDTGSLALGGALGSIAVATKHELVLAIVGGLFVLEAASVIVQVASFRLFGKRVFRMAPLHHHFEQKGWPESTVVVRFWIIAVVLALAGLATLKLR